MGGEAFSVKVNVCLDVGCRRVSSTNKCERKWYLLLFVMAEERRRRNEGRTNGWTWEGKKGRGKWKDRFSYPCHRRQTCLNYSISTFSTQHNPFRLGSNYK